jgi:hypothetical protein
MERQLVLIEERPHDDRLDEHTREIGRRGVAAAREMLRRAADEGGDGGPGGGRNRSRHGRRTAA